MPYRPPRTASFGRRPRAVLLASAATLALGLSACQGGSEDAERSGSTESGTKAAGSPERALAPLVPQLRTVPGRGASGVPVDTAVQVEASDGRLKQVKVSSEAGRIPGALRQGKSVWKASEMLEPGTTYDVVAVATGDKGTQARQKSSFTTADLTLDEQTYPSVAPLQGETVGVGMPVIVNFDVAVTDRAAFEKRMSVETTPRQAGAWRWLSGNEAHWRPRSYWKPGTKVSVDVDVNGLSAGGGIYGQEDRAVDFTVGDAHVYKVDAQSHQMQVFSNGSLLRTIPITTGKAGFTTRSGTKVIMEKFAEKRMNSETIGINPDSAEGYDLDNVEYAMRVTYSGEFIHAAPWSVGSQGSANVSHGCTGLSTENAGWLYAMTRRGDVVEYTGTDRPMTLENGYGDWNTSFGDYKQGSAL